MKIAVSVAATCLCVVGLAAGGDAQAVMRNYELNIPRQSLDAALRDLAQQTGLQIARFSDTIDGDAIVGPVTGKQSAEEALKTLLAPGGLRYKVVGEKMITILSPTEDTAAATTSGASSPGVKPEEANVEEIVVTAQKRMERLQDVPVPVTAVNADALVSNNQVRLQDFYTSVPGLSVAPAAGQYQGSPMLAIRGVTTGGGNPTVAIIVDDVPYGSSTTLGGGIVAPDVDPSDLARIEVLRGPQGTLYGASSIGGLLKYVTIDPSTAGFSGRVQGGISSVRNDDGLAYNVRGAVNVPLSDTLALRASGFTRQDAGYIDNVQTGERGVNSGDAQGGRLSALWKPSDAFSLKVSALAQKLTGDGSPQVDLLPGLADLQQSTLRDTGGYERKIQAYNATLTAKLGDAELTSVSGYGVNDYNDSFDITPLLSALTQRLFGVTASPLFDDNHTTKFTQEIRVTAPLGARLDLLVGAFYTDEDTEFAQSILAVDAVTGAVAGSWLQNSFPTTYKEYAGFADLTFHFTDRFDVQVGGRQSKNEQTYVASSVGPYVGGVAIVPKVESKDSSFTYLVTPRFKVSPDLMLYARLASGYRPGGPNSNCVALGIPCEFNPDETRNFEIGVKGNVPDTTFSYDASLYYIDWKDLQLNLLSSVGAYFANASRATSQGAELAIEARPLSGLKVALWVAWNDAKLTEDFPAQSTAQGKDGARLPQSSRFSGNLSFDQEFSITANATAFVGGALSYVGDRVSYFASAGAPPDRQHFPAYAQTDLRAGLRYDLWAFNLFVNNVTDKRGVLMGGIGTLFPTSFTYIQPRTVGLSLSKTL